MMVMRAVEAGDAQSAEALLRAAFAPYVRRLGREQTPDAYAWIASALRDGRMHGAYQDANLVGVAVTCQTEDGWVLDQIAVEPALQGTGTGSALLRHIEAHARARGTHSLSLDTATIMTELRRLYERHGFRETRRGLPSHGKDEHERVYMTKTI